MIKDEFKPVIIENSKLLKLIDDYISLLNGRKPQTIATYSKALSEFAQFHKSLPDFKFLVKDIEKYKNHLHKNDFKENTIITYLKALRRFLSYLVENNIIEKNPAKRINIKNKSNTRQIEYLTENEVNKIINSIDTNTLAGKRDAIIFFLMVNFGITQEEIVNLNLANLRRSPRTSSYKLILQDEKFDLSGSTANIITQYLQSRTNRKDKTRPLFISCSNRSGNSRLTKRGLKEILSRILKKYSAKPASPHIIRRTAANFMIKAGKDPAQIMKRLKIKNEKTVLRYF